MAAAFDHDGAGNIGERLRQARGSRGLSLHDAAAATKLSISVLRAIERNDFDSLPPGIYRKAYIRTLAAEVGLDPDTIAAEYSTQFEPRHRPPDINHNAAPQDPLIGQLAAPARPSAITLLVLAALAGAWFLAQPAPATPPVPPLVETPEPVATEDAPDSFTPAFAAAETAVPLRIEVSASGWCWVDAQADGERVIYRLIEPGERLVLDATQAISLRLGDAGSVMVSINDGPSQSPGGPGEVVELEVTAENVGRLSG